MNNTLDTGFNGHRIPPLNYTSTETDELSLNSSTNMGNPLPPNELKRLEQRKLEQMLNASPDLPKVRGPNGLPLPPLNYMPAATLTLTPVSKIYSSPNIHNRSLLQPPALAVIGATNAEHNRTPNPPLSPKPKRLPRRPKEVMNDRSDSELRLTINDMDNPPTSSPLSPLSPLSQADNTLQNNSLCRRLGNCLGIHSNKIANNTAGGKFTKNKRRKLRSSHKKVRAKRSKHNKHKRSSKRNKRYTRKH
jgi:hypothetical protein